MSSYFSLLGVRSRQSLTQMITELAIAKSAEGRGVGGRGVSNEENRMLKSCHEQRTLSTLTALHLRNLKTFLKSSQFLNVSLWEKSKIKSLENSRKQKGTKESIRHFTVKK